MLYYKRQFNKGKKVFNPEGSFTYDENTDLFLPWCIYDRVRYFYYIWNQDKQRYESMYFKYLPLELQKILEV